QWNDEQTDATLVPASGGDRTLVIKDAKAPGGVRKQNWHFHSRTECLTCHNPWAGYTLAFTMAQLTRGIVDDIRYGEKPSQIRSFLDAGIISSSHKDWDGSNEVPLTGLPQAHLTQPHSEIADLNDRARSYLHANCAHCHRFGAGGTADLQLRF